MFSILLTIYRIFVSMDNNNNCQLSNSHVFLLYYISNPMYKELYIDIIRSNYQNEQTNIYRIGKTYV